MANALGAEAEGKAGVIPDAVARAAEVMPGWAKAVVATLLGLLGVFAASTVASRRALCSARRRALTDVLTGLPNRGFIDETLARMAAHAKRTRAPLAAVLFDLDHFKDINDTYGHAKGDEVLAAVGGLVRDELRAGDFVGRYGGEEFLALMPDTDEAGAAVAAEKLRRAMSNLAVPGLDRPITASFGVAAVSGAADEAYMLVQTADRALYLAKENGRNRVETVRAVAPEEPLVTVP